MKNIVLFAVVFIVWAIRNSKIKARFENKNMTVSGAIGLIKAAARNSINMPHVYMFFLIHEFSVLKAFSIY